MVSVPLYLGVALLLGAVTGGIALASLHIVPDDEVQALVLFGEVQTVLAPGKLHFVPPFISEVHPIDTSTHTIQKDGERVTIPEEYELLVDQLDAERKP
jgi:regulator of protease activity HflC (stomatin/prohibitin superfamily)